MKFTIKAGSSPQQILDGTQTDYTLISVQEGSGLLYVGGYSESGFPFPMGALEDRRIVLPPGETASMSAGSATVRGTTGNYGAAVTPPGPINSAPVFTSGTTVSVPEGSTSTGYIATAIDAEMSNISYGISGGMDAALFTIEKTSGALSFITAPDFEGVDSRDTYEVILSATDGVATATHKVAVRVTDVLEQIAWTPSMISVNGLFEANQGASMLNASGAVATEGQAVATWRDQSGGNRHLVHATTPTFPNNGIPPVLGTPSPSSRNGTRPLVFDGTMGMASATFPAMTEWSLVVLARMRDPGTSSRFILANNTPSVGVQSNNIIQSSSSEAGSLRAFQAPGIEVSTADRLRTITQVRSASATNTNIRGLDSGGSTQAGAAFPSGARWFLGSSNGQINNGIIDVFAFAVVPHAMTLANKQRLEGYLAWSTGLEGDDGILHPAHPYKSAPPMVPAGTTSTIEMPMSATAAQTYLGGFTEVQVDSFNGGAQGATAVPATDSTTDLWGLPYSLTAAEKTRMRDAMFPGDGTMHRYIRFPLGFAYRGLRNIDGTSGLARNIGERYAGQNQSVADLLANVVPGGGGLLAEYWSPAPHWKTTSAYANGRLWAGTGYSRATSLDSIRTSAPTAYAAQIEAFTTAVVNDLEYLHANVGPVRGFALQNEAISTIEENYGTCIYSATEYMDVWKSVVPKIRASSVLATYGGNPNSVLIHAESWNGLAATAALWDSATALSTGKTALQELWAQSIHQISAISADPDYIKTNAASLATLARGRPTIISEFEYFTPGNYTDAQRFARTALKMVHELNLLGSPAVMPIIHMVKPLGQNGSASSTLGYALTKARLPEPYGIAPGSTGDVDPTIGYGEFDFIAPNYNAAKFLCGNLPAGAVIHKVSLTGGPAGLGCVGAKVAGKFRIFIVNLSTVTRSVSIGLPSSGTYSGKRYSAGLRGAPIAGTRTGASLSVSIPANCAECWIEA